MVLLDNSRARRPSGRGAEASVIDVTWSGGRGYDHDGIEIFFNIGTANKSDSIAVTIPGDDYAVLIKEMIENNRRAFLDGLAKALLANPDHEPGPPR